MRLRTISLAAALCVAGPVFADDGKPSGGDFSYHSTWGDGAAYGGGRMLSGGPDGTPTAPSHGDHASDRYNTHCGPGGWDANGGRIPDGCRTGPAISSSTSPIGTELPDAQPGECFARVVIPAEYDHVPETVTVQDSYDELDVTQAVFNDDRETVQVRDPSVKYIVREPRYEVRTEEVMVKPAHERLEIVPAKFTYVTEHIQVGEPRLVWKPGKNLSGIQRKDPNTGAVYCLVEEPGETVAVQRRVLERPEEVRAIPVPAKFATVTKQVLVDPGGVEEVPVPAEYKDVPVKRLAAPAGSHARAVAPQTKTVTRRVLRAPERFEWVPVLCDTNATHSSISHIQSALAARGYYHGAPDGRMGPRTQAALDRFQTDNGIPHAGYVSLDTLGRLGLGELAGGRRHAAAPPRPPAPPIRAGSASTAWLGASPARPEPRAPSVREYTVPAGSTADRVLNWSGKRSR